MHQALPAEIESIHTYELLPVLQTRRQPVMQIEKRQRRVDQAERPVIAVGANGGGNQCDAALLTAVWLTDGRHCALVIPTLMGLYQ